MYRNLIGQYWLEPSGFSNGKTPQKILNDAVEAFYRNPGLAGLKPQEIHVNEAQCHLFPPEVEKDGLILPIIPNITTQSNHVWVCCPDEEVA